MFRHEGDFWMISYQGRTSRVRDCLGLRYLALLLERRGSEVAALEMVTTLRSADPAAPNGQAAPLLDARAIQEYRSRLAALGPELDEARAANDLGRCELLQGEIDCLKDELCATTGLGGRSRRFSSAGERARLNVGRAIRTALRKIAGANPALGEHLSRAIHTGGFCSYDPDPAACPDWDLGTGQG